MDYCTDADLARLIPERTLVELSNDDPAATMPDAAVLADARSFGQSQCDARLRKRYTLPLPGVPEELRHWAAALARWWLYTRRPGGPAVPTEVSEAKADALRALDAVRDAKMDIDLPPPTDPGGGETIVEAGRLHRRGPERTFSDDLWSRYG